MQGSPTGLRAEMQLRDTSSCGLTAHCHCPDAASAKTVASAPGPTVRVTAASPATTARSATAAAWLATTETAAGRSAPPAAGITNPVTTKLEGAGGVTQDGRDPGVCSGHHGAVLTFHSMLLCYVGCAETVGVRLMSTGSENSQMCSQFPFLR